VALLYVGQGDSSVVIAADGQYHKTMLVDTNLDAKCGGIDVPRLMVDLLDGAALDVFVNTHPHKDHLCGLKELAAAVEVRDVWHSGHVPGNDHCEPFAQLTELMEAVSATGGEIVELLGCRHPKRFGDLEYRVVLPGRVRRRGDR